MSEITASKAELALDLTNAGLDVVAYIPGRVTPPLVIVKSGSPYISNETVGNGYLLSLELLCVASTADNETATEDLDQLIEDVLNALPPYATMKGVTQPFALDVNNAQYLSATINTDLAIEL